MRRSLLVVALALAPACRSQELPPPDLSPRPLDLSVRLDLMSVDLAAKDLRDSDMDDCDPQHPDGYCPPGFTCCAFDCWGGGGPPNGWCFEGPGCPIC